MHYQLFTVYCLLHKLFTFHALEAPQVFSMLFFHFLKSPMNLHRTSNNEFSFEGVELSGQLEDKELTLRKILFLPAQGRLITLAAPENILHFWEIEDNKIEKVVVFPGVFLCWYRIPDLHILSRSKQPYSTPSSQKLQH